VFDIIRKAELEMGDMTGPAQPSPAQQVSSSSSTAVAPGEAPAAAVPATAAEAPTMPAASSGRLVGILQLACRLSALQLSKLTASNLNLSAWSCVRAIAMPLLYTARQLPGLQQCSRLITHRKRIAAGSSS